MKKFLVRFDTAEEVNQEITVEALNESYAMDAFYYEVQEDDPTAEIIAVIDQGEIEEEE